MGTNGSAILLASAADYLNVAALIAVVCGIAVGILILTHLVGPRRVGPRKQGTYESGMAPVGDTRRRFSVQFYLVAVLFLVFDVELLFFWPWAVLTPRLHALPDTEHAVWAAQMTDAGYTPGYMLAAIGVFFGLLLVGFYYEWRRGVFKWN